MFILGEIQYYYNRVDFLSSSNEICIYFTELQNDKNVSDIFLDALNMNPHFDSYDIMGCFNGKYKRLRFGFMVI